MTWARVWCMLSFLLCVAFPGNAAQWHVSINGADIPAVTVLERGDDMPMVNLLTLAPSLGLSISVRGGDVLQLIDKMGTQWQAIHGAITLTCNRQSIPLSTPAFVQGGQAYLPAPVLAELAGYRLVGDVAGHQLMFKFGDDDPVGNTPDASDSSDWQAFTLEKNPWEKANSILPTVLSSNQSSHPATLLYQPPRDLFRWGAGLGYVEHGKLGLDVIGNGMVNGVKVNFGASLTDLQDGARLQSLRGSLRDEESGWQLDGGDVSSDLNGNVRGVRYARRLAFNHWPAALLFTRNTPGDAGRILFALQDEVPIGTHLRLGGELVSNGAFLLKGQYTPTHWSLSGFHREEPGQDTVSSGVNFSHALSNRISLSGGMNHAQANGKSEDWRNLSLSIPLIRTANLIFDVSQFANDTTSNTIYAAMLGIPVGPVQLLMRYQWNSTSQSFTSPQLFRIETANQNLNVSAHYTANPRLNFDYQVTSQWNANGNQGNSQQLISSYRLSPRTQFQVVSAFPHFTDHDHLLLRVTQSLGNGYALAGEYGKFSPSQGTGTDATEFGFKFMLRKEWGIKTSARGGEVSGRVTDLYGHPAPAVEVLLGAYCARTNKNGQYKFSRVPPGAYTVHVDETSLPATLRSDNGHRPLVITSRSREVVDFRVIPLNSITGHVYIDRNGNSQYDAGEGMKLAVLRLADTATTSDDSGSFGFYNLPPGKHVIQLDGTKLPADIAADSPVEAIIQLAENNTITGMEFRLRHIERPVDFQTLE